ncbi:glycosyl hydrolase [Pseudonocardia sp. NPDC049635]|uniref:glycoside hydrolase family 26 protein n=1 Tax=Pseudonocardia sp. NPDC049635 TaxID=3155506 RepID=UPI0033F766B8
MARRTTPILVAVLTALITGCVAPGTPAGEDTGLGGVFERRQLFGAFLGSDAEGVRRIPGFEEFLGGVDTEVGHTYLPGEGWTDVEGPDYILDPWAEWQRQNPDDLFVLNVPMADRNEADLPDEEVAELLRRGRAGEFDHHFTLLGERLVERGLGRAVIVPGWEMNGETYSHRCGPDPEAWQGYFRNVVTAMRAVPGQDFRFDFTVNRGTDDVDWTSCYPGDDVVDIIGMDTYDQGPGRTFDDFVEQPLGLREHADFAAARGKPVSFPEWGLFRNGDNPEFIRRMHDWIASQDTVYSTLTDYCPHGVFWCTDNPRSAEVFRELFGS